MADTVISTPHFPAGTEVDAFYQVHVQPHADRNESPGGLTPESTETVDEDGVLTFTDLDGNAPYLLHAVLTHSQVVVDTAGAADPAEDQVDVVDLRGIGGARPTAGTFTLTVAVDGGTADTTAGIAYDASPADVLLALEALDNVDVGDVAVTADSDGGPWTLTWGGTLAATPIETTIDASGVTGATQRRYLTVVGTPD